MGANFAGCSNATDKINKGEKKERSRNDYSYVKIRCRKMEGERGAGLVLDTGAMINDGTISERRRTICVCMRAAKKFYTKSMSR